MYISAVLFITDIVTVMKSRRNRCVGNVAHAGKQKFIQYFSRKILGRLFEAKII